jgi:hypothetical protein
VAPAADTAVAAELARVTGELAASQELRNALAVRLGEVRARLADSETRCTDLGLAKGVAEVENTRLVGVEVDLGAQLAGLQAATAAAEVAFQSQSDDSQARELALQQSNAALQDLFDALQHDFDNCKASLVSETARALAQGARVVELEVRVAGYVTATAPGADAVRLLVACREQLATVAEELRLSTDRVAVADAEIFSLEAQYTDSVAKHLAQVELVRELGALLSDKNATIEKMVAHRVALEEWGDKMRDLAQRQYAVCQKVSEFYGSRYVFGDPSKPVEDSSAAVRRPRPI